MHKWEDNKLEVNMGCANNQSHLNSYIYSQTESYEGISS